MRIFGSTERQTESAFLFLYVVIFQIWQSWEPPSFTPERNKHVRPLTFSYEIQCWTTFIWSFFSYNAYFWQHWARNWIYFLIFVHYFKDVNLSSPQAPLRREIDKCTHWLFCKKFNAEQLLFEAFPHIMRLSL